MKKLLCILLALVMTLSLCACSKEQEAEGKSQGESKLDTLENVERYFLYIEDNKLYRLDTEKENIQEISLDFPVADISNAMVCDNNQTMIARIKNNETGKTGLIYLGDGSRQAVYLGDNTELVRISKDGEIVFYLKEYYEKTDLYCYHAKEDQSKLVVEKMSGAAVSEDGNRAFMTVWEDDFKRHILYYFENDNLQKIADNVKWGTSVSQDCSAVAYMKTFDEDPFATPCNNKVYTWTKNNKEQALPFDAFEVLMFDEKNIYYCRMQGNSIEDPFAHFYYDGNETHLLTDDGSPNGHKAGNYMYSYRAQDENGERAYYLAYQGNEIKTSMGTSFITGYTIFLSPDDKCIYGWDQNDIMYQVELNDKGELKETKLRETGVYSPRAMEFLGDAIVYPKEQALYMNDDMITEEYEDYALSNFGDVLVYKKGSTLFRYADGKITEFAAGENINAFYPAKNSKVVSWQEGGSLTLHDKAVVDEKSFFGENVTQLVQVHTWTLSDSSNCTMGSERTGTWFQKYCISLIWYR